MLVRCAVSIVRRFEFPQLLWGPFSYCTQAIYANTHSRDALVPWFEARRLWAGKGFDVILDLDFIEFPASVSG